MKERGDLRIAEVNAAYDRLANHTSNEDLADARIYRSLWAKKTLRYLLDHLVPQASTESEWSLLLWHLTSLRTLARSSDIEILLAAQRRVGNSQTQSQLGWLLSQQGDAGDARTRESVELLSGSQGLLQLGPPLEPGFVPMRVARRHRDHRAWFDSDA